MKPAPLHLGYVPPQAPELEESILGAILIEKNAINRVIDLLKADDFYKEQNRVIFQSIINLYAAKKPIDLLTVCQQLKADKTIDLAGGSYSVSKLTNNVASAANIDGHAQIVKQYSMLRQLTQLGEQLRTNAYSPDANPFNLIQQFQNDLNKVVPNVSADVTPESRMLKTLKFINHAMDAKDGVSGIPYPWPKINKHTGGMQRGNSIVIAGLPGAMKTALTLCITKHLDDLGIPSLMFQQEMSSEQTGIREIAMETKINSTRIKTGQLSQAEFSQIQKAIGKIESGKRYVDEAPGLTIYKLRSVGTKMVQEYGVQLIIIDYLQLMDTQKQKNESDTAALERTTREIKSIAKELNIPIICLSQFTKEAGKDHSIFPDLSHLRGSGSIEQDADLIWITWNPCKKLGSQFTWKNPYDLTEELTAKGKIYMRDAKNRDGSNEIFEFESFPWINTFEETRMLSEGTVSNFNSGGLAPNAGFNNQDATF